MRDNLDHLRKLLIFEPRGHYDMYGALLVEPNLPGADLAVLFMHNEGYSTMCGHAVIALGRYAVDQGMVAAKEPVTTVNIECPCGMVVASVEVNDGKAGAVSFESVPAFLFARDREIELPDGRTIRFDIAYGGAFYAMADCRQWGLAFGVSPVRDFVDAATALSEAVKRDFNIEHPDADDLGFLYGSILTDGGDGNSTPDAAISASSPMPRSTVRRPVRVSPRGWPRCMPGRNRAWRRRGSSKASPARSFPARCCGKPSAGRTRRSSPRVGGRASIPARPSSGWSRTTIGQGFLLR